MRSIVCALVALAVSLGASSAFADIYLGAPGAVGCIPFGCSGSDPLQPAIQQVFAGQSVGENIFTDVSLRTVSNNGLEDTVYISGSRLFYTSATPGNLSTNPSDNEGAPLPMVFTGPHHNNPGFLYDPALGNLLVEFGPIGKLVDDFYLGYPLVIQNAITPSITTGIYLPPGATQAVPFDGLWVRIDTVPEPATWALLLAGFFSTGAALRRGRRVAAPRHPF